MRSIRWVYQYAFYVFWCLTFLSLVLLFVPSKIDILDTYFSLPILILFILSIPQYFELLIPQKLSQPKKQVSERNEKCNELKVNEEVLNELINRPKQVEYINKHQNIVEGDEEIKATNEKAFVWSTYVKKFRIRVDSSYSSYFQESNFNNTLFPVSDDPTLFCFRVKIQNRFNGELIKFSKTDALQWKIRQSKVVDFKIKASQIELVYDGKFIGSVESNYVNVINYLNGNIVKIELEESDVKSALYLNNQRIIFSDADIYLEIKDFSKYIIFRDNNIKRLSELSKRAFENEFRDIINKRK